MRTIELIGVPTSMGAFAPGLERAPEAIRHAGLIGRLDEAGFDVRDHGDLPGRRWFPDREHPKAQHVDAVVEMVLETTRRVAAVGGLTLVLGGDCTVGLGTVAGLQARGDGRVGLVYVDLHADMNVPSSVTEGALDWMGIAHALGVDGTEPRFAKAFDRFPLLDPQDLWLFSRGSGTDFERAWIERLEVRETPVDAVRADPGGEAGRMLEMFGRDVDRLAVHLDVDVIDYMSLPISENAGRNEGLTAEATFAALRILVAHPAVDALTICELNPDHDPDGAAVARFVDELVGALAG